MAVKGIAIITDVNWEGEDTFNVQITYIGMTNASEVKGAFNLVELSPTISALTFESNVKSAVKDKLIADHGFSFGPLDSVRLIGATL